MSSCWRHIAEKAFRAETELAELCEDLVKAGFHVECEFKQGVPVLTVRKRLKRIDKI